VWQDKERVASARFSLGHAKLVPLDVYDLQLPRLLVVGPSLDPRYENPEKAPVRATRSAAWMKEGVDTTSCRVSTSCPLAPGFCTNTSLEAWAKRLFSG